MAIKLGILTIREKWEKYLGYTTTTITEEYLSEKFPMVELDKNIMINASFLPNPILVEMILELQPNQIILYQEEVVAFYSEDSQENIDFDNYDSIYYDGNIIQIVNKWDIFEKNDQAIREDFELLTENRTSQPIPASVNVMGHSNIFIEEGAKLEFVTLNATTGPIYIGKNSEIMEGSAIRGPFALCEFSQVKLGTKIYGATTVGPHSRVGGELNNSVIFGYSNKGHDGFLGNSVIGEWCNLGADTNNSNLKNNYAAVKIWSYELNDYENTGLQFCGLMMGDYSKSGINTMFNTGTVVGVSSNIFGAGFPSTFIPNFKWGGCENNDDYLLDKALETIKVVMLRRNIDLSNEDIKILKHLYAE